MKPKILYAEIVRKPSFYLDSNEHFYPEATTFILTGKYLNYLVQFLNSDIVSFVFRTFYAGGGLGEDGYRYKKQFIIKLPIPLPTDDFITINEQIIANLYHLTDEEVEFIQHQ